MRIKKVVRLIDFQIGSPLIRMLKHSSRWKTIRKIDRYKKSNELSFEVAFPFAQDDDLTKLLVRFGSDKALSAENHLTGGGHFYSYFYRSLFSSHKEKTFNLLEFGIDQGASLRAWSEYFPKASIFGVDYRRDFLFETEKIKTFEVDMYSPPSLRNFVEKVSQFDFDIIIDDGPHDFLSTKNTWQICFPTFAEDFIYVCEDIPMREFESYAKFFENEARRLGLKFYFVFFNQKGWPEELHGSNDYNTLAVLSRY
jgi:hypothetical protein